MGYIRVVNSTGNRHQELWIRTYALNQNIWQTFILEKASTKVQKQGKDSVLTLREYLKVINMTCTQQIEKYLQH